MLVSLAIALLALRLGLSLRRARRLGVRRDGRTYRRHLHLAKLAVLLLPAGFAAGVCSAVVLRGWGALGSAHGWISTGALAAFLGAAFLGRRLEGPDLPRARWADVHGLLGVLAALVAAASLVSGFGLLP